MSDTVVIQSIIDLPNHSSDAAATSGDSNNSVDPVKLDTRPLSAPRNSTGQTCSPLSPPSSPDSDVEGLDYYYSSPGEDDEDDEKSRGSRGSETAPITLNDDDPFIRDFGIFGNQQQQSKIDNLKQDPHVPVASTEQQQRQQRQPKMTFDLAAFARHLHEHRLSVMQASRQSRIVLTEQDELELENLLKKHPLPLAAQSPDNEIRQSMFLKKLNERTVPTRKADESNADKKNNVRPTESLSDPTNAFTSPRRAPQPPKRLTPPARPPRHYQLPSLAQSTDDAVPTTTTPSADQQKPAAPTGKSLGLFGSLRQRTRSQSPGPIKGLMRTLSTSSVLSATSLRSNQRTGTGRSASMSPAAIAVINHDKQPAAFNEQQQQKTIKRTLSQLLTKRRVVTKTINMDHNESERKKIVRRTIILVEPDPANGASIECSKEDDDVQGVEVREMSDGSVVWGMVDAHHRSSPPPPIPKRSPQRIQEEQQRQRQQHQCLQNTDVYYAPEMVLPSLVQMMSTIDREPPPNMSVEEQLDEFMRSLGYDGN